MPRILIAGTSYVDSPDRLWLVRQWHQVVRVLNPGIDVLVVDTPASIGFPDGLAGVKVIRLPDNVGHLMQPGGRDGWGRAFTHCLQEGMDRGYDQIAFFDTDLLFMRPVASLGAYLANKRTAKALSCRANPYPWPEGLLFADLLHLKVTGFIGRYSWESMKRGDVPEKRISDILGDSLQLIPWQGCRNEDGAVTPGNLKRTYFGCCDWMTHSRNLDVYRALMWAHGIETV